MSPPRRRSSRRRRSCSPRAASTGSSVADIGAACGISGPALYKHFAVQGRRARRDAGLDQRAAARGRPRARPRPRPTPRAALAALVDWHVDFALRDRPLIVVQDRDWESLPDEAREQVRTPAAGVRRPVGRPAPRGAPRAAPRQRPGDGARGVRADQLHAAQRAAARRPDARAAHRRWPAPRSAIS